MQSEKKSHTLTGAAVGNGGKADECKSKLSSNFFSWPADTVVVTVTVAIVVDVDGVVAIVVGGLRCGFG